ncbi:MAG: hypothetical protein ACRENO_00230 [Thermodesulfobacteriota bacterium]
MKKSIDLVLEKSFGLIFLILGTSGFHKFLPFINLDRFIPELHPFMQILTDSGYFYVVKAIEVTAGTLIVFNRYIPLALTLITPVIVNIILYHIFIDPRNWGMAPYIVLADIYLIRKNWFYFKLILNR